MNMMDEWINGAYDEQGDQVYCSWCGGEMKWNPDKKIWFCRECETEMERSEYFNYIGAEPKDGYCESMCRENYPFCRQWCERG